MSFYFESTRANESTESYWWLRERQWRLSKVGVDQDKASLIWERAQPIFTKLLREETDILQRHLDGSIDNEAFVQISEHSQTQQVRLPGF